MHCPRVYCGKTSTFRNGSENRGSGSGSIIPKDEVWLKPRIFGLEFRYRVVDVTEELVHFTVLSRGHADQLVDRYSERKDRKQPVVTPAELMGPDPR